MSKETKAITGLVAALVGLAITLSGHWIVGNLVSVVGVSASIILLAKSGN